MNVIKGSFFSAVILIFGAAAYSQDQGIANTKPLTADASAFAWFAGCWELSVPERKMNITEIWTKPAGGALFGVGRTVVNDKTVSYEFMRLVSDASGVNYIVKPSSHSAEVSFKMIKNETGEVIFQNLENDFPQRIIYRKQGENSIFARIEGDQKDPKKHMDLPMQRIKCE